MRLVPAALVLAGGLFLPHGHVEAQVPQSQGAGCLKCHQGIEPIRAADSGMMRRIVALGEYEMDANPACLVVLTGDSDALVNMQRVGQDGRTFRVDRFKEH